VTSFFLGYKAKRDEAGQKTCFHSGVERKGYMFKKIRKTKAENWDL